jgi:hypothetical protein
MYFMAGLLSIRTEAKSECISGMRLLVLVGICGADGGSLIIAILFGILSSALVYECSFSLLHIGCKVVFCCI